MKKRKYNMSLKRRIRDLKSFNYQRGLQVLTLRNQGWTFKMIGTQLGVSHQRAVEIYKQMSGLTVEEAELIEQCLNKLPIA